MWQKIWLYIVVKNQPANAGDLRDSGLIPWSGRDTGRGNGNPLAWKIPWTEEPGSPWGRKSRIQLSN